MGLETETWAITGAAGAIGTTLRRALGPEVGRLVSIDIAPVSDPLENETPFLVDVGDLAGMCSALDGADGVIHLAGIASEGDFRDIATVNVLGTFTVFEAARRSGVGRVVFASSNHATGLYPSDAIVDPTMLVRPDTYYGVAKVAGEAVGRLFVEKFGFAVACLRIGTFAERPTQRRHLATWASPSDTAAAFRAAMVAPDLGFAIFYVVSDNRDRYWNLADGERYGFFPTDHAEDYEDEVVGEIFPTQGGPFSEASATADLQRP